ncbi:MAG: hypothetical protein GY799_14220 [Desulfobulbaceae bacterium]|nr:hypothetical protein [Desulfobulbaceae bacterium]
MPEQNNKKYYRWYSNDSLLWIWTRSFIAAIIGLVIVLMIGFEKYKDVLLVSFGVPLSLGISNSFFRKNSDNNKNSDKI